MHLIHKILIIEDHDAVSSSLDELLTGLGYEVAVARNGKEGMDRLINHELPHLILLDLFMPVMSGAEFRQRQMQIPYLASIPVIVMSADSAVNRRCISLGLKHFLKKPFSVEELIKMIETV